MEEKEKINAKLHFIMCFSGGFIGGYSVLSRMDILGSAQTSNIMGIIFSALGTDLVDFIVRLGALTIYVLAIVLTVILTRKTPINQKHYAIMVNIICAIVVSVLPMNIDPVLALYPVFFMTATQWSVFHGAHGYSCSTIFSTNNTKQTVLAYTNYFFDRDKKDLQKGQFFLRSLCSFYLGVAISYFASRTLGLLASLLCIIPMLMAFYFTHKEALNDHFIKEHANQKTVEI